MLMVDLKSGFRRRKDKISARGVCHTFQKIELLWGAVHNADPHKVFLGEVLTENIQKRYNSLINSQNSIKAKVMHEMNTSCLIDK